MHTSSTEWPDDADGDVFRSLAAEGFDFSRKWDVEYNVDFDNWPPAEAALEQLRARFGEIEICAPDDLGDGYVLLTVHGLLTYEGVMSVQRSVTAAMQPFGGVCDSWGVLH